MNYLAHLHIAEFTKSSFTGNFLGDFVKGDPSKQFPEDVVLGIKLHRFVDSYTDQHLLTKQSKQLFPESLKRFAPIALDMFWDHCLAIQWQQFHHLTLAQFCGYAEQKIAQEVDKKELQLPASFTRVNRWVWQDRWIESYQKLANIQYGLQRMASRKPRLSALAETGKVLEQQQKTFKTLFTELYPQVLSKSEGVIKELREKGD